MTVESPQPVNGSGSAEAWKGSPLAQRVGQQTTALQRRYAADESGAVSALARLRNSVGKAPGEDPAAWSETLRIVGEDLGFGDAEITAREWAAHLALTLFALHQQSHRQHGMHRVGRSMGHAVRELARAQGGDDDESVRPVLRRFQSLATASALPEISHHARSLIAQFRSAEIPLDYGRLCDDLIGLQDRRRADQVRLRWARDYYRPRREPADATATVDTESGEH